MGGVGGGVGVCASLSQKNRCDAAFGCSGDVWLQRGKTTGEKKKYRAPQIVFVRIPATRDCRSTMCSSAPMCPPRVLEAKQKCRYESERHGDQSPKINDSNNWVQRDTWWGQGGAGAGKTRRCTLM